MQTEPIGMRGAKRKRGQGEQDPPKPTPMLHHRKFHKPVRIQRRRIDRDRIIADTRIALDTLRYEWVKPDCPLREKAIQACMAVIRGQKPPHHARRAFIAAAESAGVLLES